MRGLMRKLIFNLHLYLALLAGVFLVIMGLTGTVMAFETEIDRVIHWKLSHVQPGPKALSLEEVGALIAKAFPGERIEAYRPSVSPGLSYQVILEESGTVYVNQYTGDLLGVRPDRMEFLDYVHQLHLRLGWRREGDPGKKIISWAGVALLGLLLSGLYLWWPLKRVAISKGAAGRRWWFDLHNAAGAISLVFLLALTLTGVVIGFERTTEPMLYKLTGSHPSQMPKSFPPPLPGAKPISVDQAMEIARQVLPGAAPFMIIIPGPTGGYRIALRYPEDRTPGGRSRVVVDQYTGQVLFAEGSRNAPAGARLVIANRAIHTGDILGVPSKIIMSLASLMLVLQATSGAVMWWRRIRAKRNARSLARQAASQPGGGPNG
jgi:uncharacterized iron-regulated membrane protein